MFPAFIRPLLPANAAVLLVLLPTVAPNAKQETPLARAATNLLLKNFQLQLGAAIRVLKVDEISHPAVMRAFDGQGAPAFVLLRDGEELYRQQGIPEGNSLATLLLSKLVAAENASAVPPTDFGGS